MIREIDVYQPYLLDDVRRNELSLLLIDESAINCRNLRELQELINSQQRDVVIAMPDYQYQEGLRGFAKIQILVSIVSNIRAVIPASFELAKSELEQGWAATGIVGKSTWNEAIAIGKPYEGEHKLNINETIDEFDKAMIERAKAAIPTSNCWLDAPGVVFVRDGEVLVENASMSLNNSRCTEIPISWKDLPMNPGERWFFCDAQHAERVGIARAAQEGISLNGSTLYISKFPCRPCAQSTIEAGVKEIVFEIGSYGLLETADLFEVNNITLKRVVN